MEKIDQIADKISQILINSIKTELKGVTELSVSFSGGLDSSFLTFLADEYTEVSDFDLITVCFPNTFDVENSKSSVKLLKLQNRFFYLDREILLSGIKELSEIINSKNPVEISYLLPFYFVCKNAKHKNILLGQGSDELFGGYHWQKVLNEKEFMEKTKKTVLDLTETVEKRERKIAEHFNKELIMPFFDKELLNLVLELPKDYRANDDFEKYILRLSAKSLDLPEEIVWKHKKAAQYGSGVMREMEKLKKQTDYLNWR